MPFCIAVGHRFMFAWNKTEIVPKLATCCGRLSSADLLRSSAETASGQVDHVE